MKKLILPFLAFLFIMSCTQESGDGVVSADGAIKARSSVGKVAVCHNGLVINVSVNALPAHLAHGDAIDSDGDGYFSGENDCGQPVDCNDENPDLTENCCPQGSWCFGAQGSFITLHLLFQENCDAIATFEGFLCYEVVTWDYLGSNGNVHTYHFNNAGGCGYSNCIATVVDNGTSLTVTYDCNFREMTMTPCAE